MGDGSGGLSAGAQSQSDSAQDDMSAPNLDRPFFALGSSSWTDGLPKTDHVDFFRSVNFANSGLGPIDRWGPSLRLYVSMMLANSRPTALYWGPDRIALYNEGQSELVGTAHPALMGQTFKEGFPTIVDAIMPLFQLAADTAQTVDVNDIQLFPVRRGRLEETFFIGQFIPLRGDSGEIEGFFNTVHESTFQVLYDRRRRVLDNIASIPPTTVNETLSQVVEALRANPNDVTMAMLYSVDEVDASGGNSVSVRGSIGVPEGAKCAPSIANLDVDTSGLVPFFRQAKESGAPIVLDHENGSLQAVAHLFEQVTWCGYEEDFRNVVIVPLSSGEKFLGFYVQGTNPRRPFDQAVLGSIVDMTTQISAKWISSMSTEEARKRETLLQKRLTDQERRLRTMAQSAPVGMCQITQDYVLEWANDPYFELTGHERSKVATIDLFTVVAPEHRKRAMEDFDGIFTGDDRLVAEYPVTRTWSPPGHEHSNEPAGAAWVLAVAFPMHEDGRKLAMIYLTDISHQKWAESVQSHHAERAVLAKKQQEDFIDMISHEMRNPLTAMMQLADGISKSLPALTGLPLKPDDYRAIVEDNVEAANTILTCTAHQKRIIDDVLILSRLESHMLSITPVVERPAIVLKNTVKMFDGEIAMSDMLIDITKHPSYDELHVDRVLCDTSRVMQVLINLISNAIKFTAKQSERKITITYGASRERPQHMPTAVGDLKWLPQRHSVGDNAALPPLKEGETPLYLYFCVRDTGAGVKPGEMDNLFKRFSQANSKTHVVYGGSGLGLYICRELVEKQGGKVGAASRPDEGSVFGFYIETRHVDSPTPVSHAGVPVLPHRTLSQGSLGVENIPSSTTPPLVRKFSEHRYHVLLVEDNLVNQKIFAKHLQRAGFGVTVANHGGEALEALAKSGHWQGERLTDGDTKPSTSIDVVLLDWEMPVMNGLQCCQRIRELEREHLAVARLPIIAITANVRQEQISQALAAGMDSVLSKPFTVDDLLGRVRDTILQGASQRADVE